ncbi:MAG: hypothetical protein QXT74_02320 [Candidatus Nezhaarchaeales archaeon]
MRGAWRVYRCPQGHIVTLKEAGPCPKCGGPVEELRSSGGAGGLGAEEWLSLRREVAAFEAKGFRFKVYGARAEVRETGAGVAVELAG